MNVFEKYYIKYMNTLEGFNSFHNEVINIPRDDFSSAGLSKLKVLAGYLLITEGSLDSEGNNYKEIMNAISVNLHSNEIQYDIERDEELEKSYFTYSDLDSHYEVQGRMIRHLMELCELFNLIESISRRKKIVNYTRCKQYFLSDAITLIPIARNDILALNINNNPLIKNLQGIEIDVNANYRPAFGILSYMKHIDRPVTKFELSILLGRVDETKTEDPIISRALELGRTFPVTQNEQIVYFFNNMGWKENDRLYVYANSQEPHFKFNVFIIFLEKFELIKQSHIPDTYVLTDYAKELIKDSQTMLVKDLERLVESIQNYSTNNSVLNDLILYQRNTELLDVVKNHPDFIKSINRRSLDNPIYDVNKKRVRNQLIAELAKIQVDYVCQYNKKKTFKTQDGSYYCEAHHIIEFSKENGPDITNNLVVVGPDAHMRIHHGSKEVVTDTFTTLIRNGAIALEQFKEMITYYNCLDEGQINILYNKSVITEKEKDELLELLRISK